MTAAPAPNPLAERSLRAPVLWGVVWGVIQAAAPLGFWWLDPATVYALSLALIAAVYIGFAVADGRPRVVAVEAGVAAVFVIVLRVRQWRRSIACSALVLGRSGSDDRSSAPRVPPGTPDGAVQGRPRSLEDRP